MTNLGVTKTLSHTLNQTSSCSDNNRRS